MILVLDNYDSFVYNLARYLEELGEDVRVVRNDAASVAELRELAPTHLVISPGPCTPAESGIASELVQKLAGEVPILGVCLGHQCIGDVFGANLIRAAQPVHGKTSQIQHDGAGIFCGLPSPFRGTRYHSLVLDPATLPDSLKPTAWTDDGVLMGIAHDEWPIWGVQFHPEAILTEHGHAMLRNFLALGRGETPPGLTPGLPAGELVGQP